MKTSREPSTTAEKATASPLPTGAEPIPFKRVGQFGFSNDPAHLESVRQWRDAAVADGWSVRPTYGNESADRACTLTRDGFSAHVLTRTKEPGAKWLCEADIHIWGPDSLSIMPPAIYDWAAIIAGARTCNACGATDVDTQRYSFAGRCCAACLPDMRAKHERGNWTA